MNPKTVLRAALALSLVASLSGCFFDDCNRCGRCSGGATSFAAADVDPGLTLQTATVWAEPDGEIVVEVSRSQYISCDQTRTESLFFRWNPNTNVLDRRDVGHTAQATRPAPTTTGGGVRSYEDVRPGLTIQITDPDAQGRTEITTRLNGGIVQMTCQGNFGVPLVCR